MSQNTHDTDEPGNRLTRRQIVTALVTTGAIAGTGAAIGSEGEPNDDVNIGGGPMSSELSHLRIDWHQGPESELPNPGVTGRFFLIEDDGGEYSAGTVLEDTGEDWEVVEGLGGGDSLWTDEDGTLTPDTEEGSISVEVAVIDGSRLYIQDEEPEEADEEDVWIDTSE